MFAFHFSKEKLWIFVIEQYFGDLSNNTKKYLVSIVVLVLICDWLIMDIRKLQNRSQQWTEVQECINYLYNLLLYTVTLVKYFT